MLRGLLGVTSEGGAPVHAARALPVYISGSTSRERFVPQSGPRTHLRGLCQTDARKNRPRPRFEPRSRRRVAVQPLRVPGVRQLAHPGQPQLAGVGCDQSEPWILHEHI